MNKVKKPKDIIVGGVYIFKRNSLISDVGVLESADLTADVIELRFTYRPNLFWRGTREQFEKCWD